MSWHPGRPPEQAQEVELRFVAIATGTRVELEHRGWEGLGPEASAVRDRYAGGWDSVFVGNFVEFCERRGS